MWEHHEPVTPTEKANLLFVLLDRIAASGSRWRMHYFITGTDTGIGKTYVTCLLLEGLRNAGIDAVGYKPVACGDRNDAVLLAAASGGIDENLVNPVFMKAPVAPYVASLLENRSVEPGELLAGFNSLSAVHETVLVEGVGGWEVPIAAGYRVSDFAADLKLPVIVVVGNKLGALNHTLLTVNAIRAKGLSCVGIFLNQLEDEMDTAMITNKGVIEDLTGVPLLDHLIYGHDFIDLDTLLKR